MMWIEQTVAVMSISWILGEKKRGPSMWMSLMCSSTMSRKSRLKRWSPWCWRKQQLIFLHVVTMEACQDFMSRRVEIREQALELWKGLRQLWISKKSLLLNKAGWGFYGLCVDKIEHRWVRSGIKDENESIGMNLYPFGFQYTVGGQDSWQVTVSSRMRLHLIPCFLPKSAKKLTKKIILSSA